MYIGGEKHTKKKFNLEIYKKFIFLSLILCDCNSKLLNKLLFAGQAEEEEEEGKNWESFYLAHCKAIKIQCKQS